MYIQLNVETSFELNSFTDLAAYKKIMEHLKMKINKSKLARDMGIDRRTIDKYLNGFVPKKKRNKSKRQIAAT